MPIYFANQELLLEDLSAEAKGWLDKYLAFEEANIFGSPPVFQSDQTGSRSGCRDYVGLPIPNYPDPPPPKINSLYWPTGATRWARFVGLATESDKDRIINTVLVRGEGAIQSGDLVISSNTLNNAAPDSFTPGSLATQMYLLPPRPVSEVDTLLPGTEQLWLIPLVDVRYYWQFRNTGVFEPDTWNDAYVSLASALGVTITRSAIGAAYDIPSPAEHWRSYANAAYMLDAVAWSIGHRVTRSITGAVYSESANDALDTLAANLAVETRGQVAGGVIENLTGLIPEKVAVIFREEGVITQKVEENATDHGFTGYVPGTAKVIHTNFPYDADDPTEAEALATQIASDFYAWNSRRYDRSFVGVKAWTPSGFDDAAEWSIGRRRNDGTYEAQTRVQTVPYNFGIEEQPQSGLACDSETHFEGYLCEDLPAADNTMAGPTGAGATRLVKNLDTGDLEHGEHVQIVNRDTTLTLEAWTYIIWTVINGENRIVWAACAGDVSSSCSSAEV